MKKLVSIAYFALIALLYLSFSSCKKDFLVPEAVNIPDTVSFSNDVLPIFAENCISSGCHNTGAIAPDLTEANAYSSLISYGFTNTSDPESSTLYLRMNGTTKPMPPTGKLPQSKVDLVLKWIEQGALDN